MKHAAKLKPNYEVIARREKAEALVEWLTRNNMTAEVAAAMTPALWADVAAQARVAVPSEDTRLMVIGRLQVRESVAAMTPEQLFAKF